jgi:single-stranded-DNA-specific exonuclease
MGNPRPRLLVPGAHVGNLRPMGEGRHLRFTVTAGGTRTPAVAFGCDGRLAVKDGEPADLAFRLERNSWNGTVEPRLILRGAWPCEPGPIEVLGENAQYVVAALEELDRALEEPDRALEEPDGSTQKTEGIENNEAPGRVVLDRRGEGSLAVLADAKAAGGGVLAVCADVGRRLDGLSARIGGFSLISHQGLESAPEVAARYSQIVVLDPPAAASHAALEAAGSGFTHLAWGDAELRFAQQMHELEYGLRTSLVALYRDLRSRDGVAGEELERLLRGNGPHGRPARLAGRLIRVLAELELVSLDRDLPALAVAAAAAQTALERSPAFRVYAKRYEDGRRFLSNPNPAPSRAALQP